MKSATDQTMQKISEAEDKICKIKYKRKIDTFLNEKASVRCRETLSRLIYRQLEFLKKREGKTEKKKSKEIESKLSKCDENCKPSKKPNKSQTQEAQRKLHQEVL